MDPREAVSLGCRVLGMEGQEDLIFGHVSVRDPDGHGVWMKGGGIGFGEVGPDDVLHLGWDGEVLDGRRPRHSEFAIHTEILSARSDVGAVVHSHPPGAVALGATSQPLRPMSHEGTLFVPPDIARFDKTGDLILTASLGQDLAVCLGDRNAALLINHGIVTVGPDVGTAVTTAILLERACRIQLRALAAGGISRWSDDDEALSKRDHVYAAAALQAAWLHLVRQLA